MIKYIVLLGLLIACNSNNTSETLPDLRSNLRIKTVHGDIVIKLLTDKAPLSTDRIKDLTQKGFYTGLTFHKVIPNFIIQTGNPTADNLGGSGQFLKDEENDLLHSPGSASMVRLQNTPNSADSQFFICLENCSTLDGKYTVFGSVTSGLENAKKIQLGDKIIDISLE